LAALAGGALVFWGIPAIAAEPQAPGRIGGIISSADTGGPLPFANVQFFKLTSPDDSVGVAVGGTFAMPPKGDYERDFAPGRYRIIVSYISYHSAAIGGIVVRQGRTSRVDVQLKSGGIRLAPVEVRSTVVRSTERAVLLQQQRSAAISDAVSAEQIKKTPDANVAEALQRVSGLSLVDSRYVFVRGLGERYSATRINGSPVSSPEPNKRVVPLDLIPAGLLDNVFIQKTFTPDAPGEFGGGVVNINTMDFPGREIWSVSVSCGAEAGTTGADFLTYDGGRTDLLGVDDGTRDIPDLIQELADDQKVAARGIMGDRGFTREEIGEMGRSFNRIWTYERKRVSPNYGFSGSYGNEVSVLGRLLGFIAGGVFKNSFDTYNHEENSLGPGPDGTLNKKTDYDATTSIGEAHLGGVASVNCRVDHHSSVHLRAVYNRTAEDETRIYEGINHDHGNPIRSTRLRYIERSMLSSNLGMQHVVPFLGNSSIEWRISYSRATRKEPDNRQYNYEYHDGLSAWRLSTRTTSHGFTRQFSELLDEERGSDLHVMVPFQAWNGGKANVKVGHVHSDKDRDFWLRRFAYQTPTRGPDLTQPPESLMVDENIGGENDQFRLAELTRETDSYKASLDITAWYFVLDIPLLNRLRMATGARVEFWEQGATTFDRFDPSKPATVVVLSETDVLPSLNLTYALAAGTNLRAAYSMTISRPDLRELSPFYMEDMDGQYRETGNPDLKRARLRSYDLRFEHYPVAGGLLAVSFFYKKLIDPIEKTLWTSSGQPTTCPMNGGEGYLYGTELEGRTSLGGLAAALRPFAVTANISLVESRTEVGTYGVQTSAERPLAGQSPYVVNLGLFYDSASRRYALSMLYNCSGRRLYGVGSHGLPDIYEQSRGSLDATGCLGLGRLRVKLAAKNLLDTAVEFEQTGYTVRKVKTGRSFSLSVSAGVS
jgi:outer membrane receptor protein involved in Fe transport